MSFSTVFSVPFIYFYFLGLITQSLVLISSSENPIILLLIGFSSFFGGGGRIKTLALKCINVKRVDPVIFTYIHMRVSSKTQNI